MSRLRIDTEDKMELLAYLQTLLSCVKALHSSLGTVMAEVEKMRESVFEDAAEPNVDMRSTRTALETYKVMGEDGIRSYDELVEEIAASQRYTN